LHTRLVQSAVVLFAIVGCDNSPTAAETPITFSAIGAYNAEQWLDASVPGSETPQPGTQLPLYLVCAVEGDEAARAAAVLTDAQLKLYENGSAELTMSVGTWSRRNGVTVASSETISRWGNWTEELSGHVALSQFNLPGLGQELRYTELGSAELPVTLTCPNGSSVASINPTLTFTHQASAP
jgi:hypothetical protein